MLYVNLLVMPVLEIMEATSNVFFFSEMWRKNSYCFYILDIFLLKSN